MRSAPRFLRSLPLTLEQHADHCVPADLGIHLSFALSWTFQRLPQEPADCFGLRRLRVRLLRDPAFEFDLKVRIQAQANARSNARLRSAAASYFFAISY